MRKYRPYLVRQFRHIDGHDEPENVEVDLEVVVYDPVTHADDLPPRRVGISVPDIVGNARGGLTDDLDKVHEDDLKIFLGVESITTGGNPRLNLSAASTMSASRSSSRLTRQQPPAEPGF